MGDCNSRQASKRGHCTREKHLHKALSSEQDGPALSQPGCFYSAYDSITVVLVSVLSGADSGGFWFQVTLYASFREK